MRLEVTRKSDLAIRALIELDTSDDDRVKTADLAERLDASPAFLAQVLTELTRHRWIDSSPGPTGGYRLAADTTALSVVEVIEAMEGPTEDGRCVVAETPCGEERFCPLHDAWTQARGVLLEHLGATTVAGVTGQIDAGADRPEAIADHEMKEP